MNVPMTVTQGNATVMTDSALTALTQELAAMQSGDPKASKLLTVLRNDYQWCRESNRRKAGTLIRAIPTAARHKFYTQLQLYMDQLFNVIEADQAEHVQALVCTQLGYQGLTHVIPDDQPLPGYSFAVPIQSLAYQLLSFCSDERYELQWVFSRLEEFPQLISPHAMIALEVLDQRNIVPPDYWIADKVLERRYERKSIDPVLCVQFGRRFIGIAEWI